MTTGENAQVEPREPHARQVEPDLEESFKTCPFCSHDWPTREDFLADPETAPVGYQIDPQDLVLGIFLFNHLECKTTMAIEARAFADLHTGPVYQERMSGSDECLGRCHDESDMDPCDNECECAWVRDVLQAIRSWPKKER